MGGGKIKQNKNREIERERERERLNLSALCLVFAFGATTKEIKDLQNLSRNNFATVQHIFDLKVLYIH